MKQIQKGEDSDEAYFLEQINHENIVKFQEHFDDYLDNVLHTFIILEYCEVVCFFPQHFNLKQFASD